MTNQSPGKVFFQFAIAVAVVALIFSISRLFLSASDRGSSAYYYFYDLSVVSQMTAFLSIVVISILATILGAFLVKEYDIVGGPLLGGGLFSLILITIFAYAYQYFGGEYFGGARVSGTAELVLTLVIGIEWFGLAAYCWYMGAEKKEPVSEQSPPSSPPEPPLQQSLPPSATSK